MRSKSSESTYGDHAEQDETGSGGLPSGLIAVDESIDRCRDQDEANARVGGEGDVVGVNGVAGDDDEDDNDKEKTEDDSPPGEFLNAAILHSSDKDGDEGDEPGEL